MIFGVDGVDSSRRDNLIKLLDIDLNWRLNKVSDGQRRRVQICLGLLKPYKVAVTTLQTLSVECKPFLVLSWIIKLKWTVLMGPLAHMTATERWWYRTALCACSCMDSAVGCLAHLGVDCMLSQQSNLLSWHRVHSLIAQMCYLQCSILCNTDSARYHDTVAIRWNSGRLCPEL